MLAAGRSLCRNAPQPSHRSGAGLVTLDSMTELEHLSKPPCVELAFTSDRGTCDTQWLIRMRRVEATCGGDVWRRRVEATCGGNVWRQRDGQRATVRGRHGS